MKKTEMVDDCQSLLKEIKADTIYGTGEFLEGTLGDLIPYLNQGGLEYLKKELLILKGSNDRF